MSVKQTVDVRIWTDDIEDDARQQLANVAALPFVRPWVAAMPDVHLGKGAAVGAVIPTRGAIIPAAVGVDIGCGMIATRTCRTRSRACAPRSSAACRWASRCTTSRARAGAP